MVTEKFPYPEHISDNHSPVYLTLIFENKQHTKDRPTEVKVTDLKPFSFVACVIYGTELKDRGLNNLRITRVKFAGNSA